MLIEDEAGAERVQDLLEKAQAGEKVMPDDPLLALQALVEEELTALHRLLHDVQEGVSGLDSPPSPLTLNAIASSLHQFYPGGERLLERLAVQRDGSLPGGAFSQVNLLAQLAREQPGRRPAVLDEALWLRLQDYLACRHFFRHAYGYTLEWAKLRPLVAGMAEPLANLQGRLTTLFASLQSSQC